jgi:hypothetical protein
MTVDMERFYFYVKRERAQCCWASGAFFPAFEKKMPKRPMLKKMEPTAFSTPIGVAGYARIRLCP